MNIKIFNNNSSIVKKGAFLKFTFDEMMIWSKTWDHPNASPNDHIGWVNKNDIVLVLEDGVKNTIDDPWIGKDEFYIYHFGLGVAGYVFGIPSNQQQWVWEPLLQFGEKNEPKI